LTGQGRFRGLVSPWIGGALLGTAAITFLAAVLDYSPTASGFDAAGHTLFPYAPQAGFLLGGFTLCMLVSTGLWGAVARIASREFMVRAAILTGLLLFGAVAGIGYALSPDQRHTSGPHSGFPVAQGGYRDSAPQFSAPSSLSRSSSPVGGQDPPSHVRRTDDSYRPDDGYDWASSAEDDMRVIWSPGRASLSYPNILAGKTEGIWLPAGGYRSLDGTIVGRRAGDDLAVKPVEIVAGHPGPARPRSCGDSPTHPCWYFCRSRSAYYPSVTYCPEPWVPE
jgi:hypothetical protein